LLVSGTVIVICMALITGMTWALFTDQTTVTNHLKAGDLKITLERVGLSKHTLNPRGFFDDVDYTEAQAYWNFSNTTKKDVFDIQPNEMIVPLTEYTAEMRIANQSDVAFKYWLEIVTTKGPNDQISSETLAKQIEVTVTVENADGTTSTKTLDRGLFLGSEADALGVIGINGAEKFTVNVKFLDDKNEQFDNDNAQGTELYFDLIVHAVQYTGAEPANP
jgi:predicted ribosomally synthesized peptide with SipW-like signal peptide